jgi:hypothetical protein
LQIAGQTPPDWVRFIDEAHVADSTNDPFDSKGDYVIQITAGDFKDKGQGARLCRI